MSKVPRLSEFNMVQYDITVRMWLLISLWLKPQKDLGHFYNVSVFLFWSLVSGLLHSSISIQWWRKTQCWEQSLSLQRKKDVWSKNKAIIAVTSSSIITAAENKLIIVPCFWLSQWRGLPIMLRSIWNPPPSSWWSFLTVSKFWWFCFPEFLLAFPPTFTFPQYVLSFFSYKSIACSLEE